MTRKSAPQRCAQVVSTACLLSLAALSLAAEPRPPGVTGETWQFGPLNRWAYTHLREILPTKDIPNAASDVRPLQGLGTAAADRSLLIGGRTEMLSAAMDRLYVDGVLVLQDGAVVVERYADTLTPERPHLLWSVSKTITGLVAATVDADGLIDLDKTVADYVPELADSGWGSDRLRDLLDMRDRSSWTEDYDAPDSTVRRQDCADGLLTGDACKDVPVVGNYLFLPTVGHAPERAGRFVYKSGTTDVIAWVLEAATGERFADLVSARLWKPLGAERSAYITVDVSGFTLASGGIAATLRDVARVGQLMIDRGRAGKRQVVPAAWFDDLFVAANDAERAQDGGYYRSFVWGTGETDGSVYASGVHGQFIYVSPATGTVIAMLSSWPNADGGAPGVGHAEAFELLRALRAAAIAN